MRSLALLSLIFASSCNASDAASESSPTAQDFQQSASAKLGALEAADEVCVGNGDISESLKRAAKTGWKQFNPPKNSMMGKIKTLYLEGDEFPRPEAIVLRKNDNRAEILLFQMSGPFGSNYLHECRVYEENASAPDEGALRRWAAVPLAPNRAGNGQIAFDLKGGRFDTKPGGLAKISFETATADSPAKGLVVSFLRSNSAPEGK